MRCNIHALGAFHVFDVSKVSVIFRNLWWLTCLTEQSRDRQRYLSLCPLAIETQALFTKRVYEWQTLIIPLMYYIFLPFSKSFRRQSETEQEREKERACWCLIPRSKHAPLTSYCEMEVCLFCSVPLAVRLPLADSGTTTTKNNYEEGGNDPYHQLFE